MKHCCGRRVLPSRFPLYIFLPTPPTLMSLGLHPQTLTLLRPSSDSRYTVLRLTSLPSPRRHIIILYRLVRPIDIGVPVSVDLLLPAKLAVALGVVKATCPLKVVLEFLRRTEKLYLPPFPQNGVPVKIVIFPPEGPSFLIEKVVGGELQELMWRACSTPGLVIAQRKARYTQWCYVLDCLLTTVRSVNVGHCSINGQLSLPHCRCAVVVATDRVFAIIGPVFDYVASGISNPRTTVRQ